ncbi:MAG: rhamnulokinase [Actinobacteria bacterium]|nr:rhamnulokinase [Actinomycetota bacterium]
MAVKNYLIFDFGASNGRGLLARYDGSRFTLHEVHRFENRPVYAAGTLYWDFLRLYSELKLGILASVKEARNISSIGIDTWGVDFGLFDRNGSMIGNTVSYRDDRTNGIPEKIYEIVPKEEVFISTGYQLLPITSLYQIYALKLKNSPVLEVAEHFLMLPDIFNYYLTGVMVNEFANATTSIMCSVARRDWAWGLLEKLGIPTKIFGEIVMPGTIVGKVQKNVRDELGVEPILVIEPATHDTSSAVSGILLKDKSRKWAFISIGTWGIMGIETRAPNLTIEALESGFANEGGVEGYYHFLKNVNGLWIIQECRKNWIKDLGQNVSWDDIVEQASKAKIFKSFLNVDEPSLIQTQLDMPGQIANHLKSKNQMVPEGIGEIARTVYEGLALRFRYNLDILEKLIGYKIELIHMVGGGTQNKLLCQFTANATGVEVIVGPTETTAIGNLLMQLKATDEIKNLDDGRQIAINSSDLGYYEPCDVGVWDEAYSRYLGAI